MEELHLMLPVVQPDLGIANVVGVLSPTRLNTEGAIGWLHLRRQHNCIEIGGQIVVCCCSQVQHPLGTVPQRPWLGDTPRATCDASIQARLIGRCTVERNRVL